MSLLGEPGFGTPSEDFGESDGHFGGDAAFSVDEFGESGASDADGVRSLSDRQAERLDALAPHKAARMRWTLHRRGLFSFSVMRSGGNPSVVLEIVDIERVAFCKAEYHSPVSPDRDRLKACELALQRMESETRQVHVRNGRRSVQTNWNIAESFGMLAHDAAMIVAFVKAF